MRLTIGTALFLGLFAANLQAQDDLEKAKARIMERLEKEIKGFYDRLGKQIENTILKELGKAPSNPDTPPDKPKEPAKPAKKPAYLGIIAARDFDDAEREKLKLEKGQGLKVESVNETTPAFKGGLRPGMVILKINDKGVTSDNMRDIMKEFSAGDEITVNVLTPEGEKKDFKVTLGERP
jgi:S1-C subfamily serine protease